MGGTITGVPSGSASNGIKGPRPIEEGTNFGYWGTWLNDSEESHANGCKIYAEKPCSSVAMRLENIFVGKMNGRKAGLRARPRVCASDTKTDDLFSLGGGQCFSHCTDEKTEVQKEKTKAFPSWLSG